MRKFVVLVATVALLFQAGAALATNQWGTNHWATETLGSVSMTVSHSGFDGVATSAMLGEWSDTTPLAPVFIGEGKDGQIVVKTGRSRLWLGRAQIWVDGSGHITKGQVKINTTLLAQLGYGSAATTHVLCQELGHVFGLAHEYEDESCMNDDTDFLGVYASPSAHDLGLLNTIYNHTDGGGGGGGDDGGGGRDNCPPNSNKPSCRDAESSGRWVTVHTFWAPTQP